MTKHFCDRCGKECMKLSEVQIPLKKTVCGSFSTTRVEVCDGCKKEADGINEKLIDIRFIMFRDFMKGGASDG